MAFNHYAKIKRILKNYPDWYVVKIKKPTLSKKFNGETVAYEHYYRVYSTSNDQPIKFCKFQQLDRFAKAMGIPPENLPIISTD